MNPERWVDISKRGLRKGFSVRHLLRKRDFRRESGFATVSGVLRNALLDAPLFVYVCWLFERREGTNHVTKTVHPVDVARIHRVDRKRRSNGRNAQRRARTGFHWRFGQNRAASYSVKPPPHLSLMKL